MKVLAKREPLLVRPGAVREAVAGALIAGMVELAERHGVSSLHVTFPEKPEWQALGAAGFLRRSGLQYHWVNRGYESFEAFLATLSPRQAQQLKASTLRRIDSSVTNRCDKSHIPGMPHTLPGHSPMAHLGQSLHRQ